MPEAARPFSGCGSQVPELSIVVPVYCSESCLKALSDAVDQSLRPAGITYELILVNDGSYDKSWKVIESLLPERPEIVGVDLRRNFGQDNAIITGLRLVRGKYACIMDDDLQHHPRYLPALIRELEKGVDVVYAEYKHKRQSFWKNAGSWANGKIAEWVLYKPAGLYLSPYKVLRSEVAELICRYTGPRPYIDGLLLQVTARIGRMEVEHLPRHAGRSTYTFWRSFATMARLAFSFSVRPVRLVTWMGFVCAVTAVLVGAGIIAYRLIAPEDFQGALGGWTSLIITFLFLSGIQMILFGILGEYVGRTYMTVNGSPQTAVREVVRGEDHTAPLKTFEAGGESA